MNWVYWKSPLWSGRFSELLPSKQQKQTQSVSFGSKQLSHRILLSMATASRAPRRSEYCPICRDTAVSPATWDTFQSASLSRLSVSFLTNSVRTVSLLLRSAPGSAADAQWRHAMFDGDLRARSDRIPSREGGAHKQRFSHGGRGISHETNKWFLHKQNLKKKIQKIVRIH